MRILVTGGGGYLGGFVIDELLKNRSYMVTSCARHSYPLLEEKGVPCIKGDLRKVADIERILSLGFDAIIHLASKKGSWGRSNDFVDTNFEATKNLIEAAQNTGVKYFIYTSCQIVQGFDSVENGSNELVYPKSFLTEEARTKAMAERIVMSSHNDQFKTAVLRLPRMWGPGQSEFLSFFIQKARSGQLSIIGDGENLIDLIYVENAAKAHYQLLSAMIEGKLNISKIYNVGQETPVKLWNFINEILGILKIEYPMQMVDAKSAYRKAYIIEKMFKIAGIERPLPPLTRAWVKELSETRYFSQSEAKKDFNYSPVVSIQDGLKKTFQLREVIKISEFKYEN